MKEDLTLSSSSDNDKKVTLTVHARVLGKLYIYAVHKTSYDLFSEIHRLSFFSENLFITYGNPCIPFVFENHLNLQSSLKISVEQFYRVCKIAESFMFAEFPLQHSAALFNHLYQ